MGRPIENYDLQTPPNHEEVVAHFAREVSEHQPFGAHSAMTYLEAVSHSGGTLDGQFYTGRQIEEVMSDVRKRVDTKGW